MGEDNNVSGENDGDGGCCTREYWGENIRLAGEITGFLHVAI